MVNMQTQVLDGFDADFWNQEPIEPESNTWIPQKNISTKNNPTFGLPKVITQNTPSQTSSSPNTLSSKAASLRGSTHQDNIQNSIDNIIEKKLHSLCCPITLEPFKDPVVDECGHSFERATIMAIYHNAISKGVPFTCPINPSKILDVNRIVTNYTLKNLIPEISCYATETLYTLEGITNMINQLEKERKKDNAIAIQEVVKSFGLENGLDDVVNMGIGDRLISVFWPSHILTVANKKQVKPFNKHNLIKRTNFQRLLLLNELNK